MQVDSKFGTLINNAHDKSKLSCSGFKVKFAKYCASCSSKTDFCFRVNLIDIPSAFNLQMEDYFLPQVSEIVEAASFRAAY